MSDADDGLARVGRSGAVTDLAVDAIVVAGATLPALGAATPRRRPAGRTAGAASGRATRSRVVRVPVRVVFRCQFCDGVPDPETQRNLEHGLRELLFGRYLDALPGRWLVWHGRGPLGPIRYACAAHRGELTAFLREHYGTVAPSPWKRPPYPTSGKSADTEKAIRAGGLQGRGTFGLPGS